jgi:hypothetical protein
VSFPVVHALEQLQQDGDEKAEQYLAAILRFEFIIALVAEEHILKSTETKKLNYFPQTI